MKDKLVQLQNAAKEFHFWVQGRGFYNSFPLTDREHSMIMRRIKKELRKELRNLRRMNKRRKKEMKKSQI